MLLCGLPTFLWTPKYEQPRNLQDSLQIKKIKPDYVEYYKVKPCYD